MAPDVSTADRVIIHSDSSFGNSPYPFNGGFIEFGNAMVASVARTSKIVPQSTWEGELDAMVVMLKEGLFAENVLIDMGVKLKTKAIITDAKSAYETVRNPGPTKKSTHVERRLMYAREEFLRGKTTCHLVTTDKMMGDAKTKVVDRTKFFKCRQYEMNE